LKPKQLDVLIKRLRTAAEAPPKLPVVPSAPRIPQQSVTHKTETAQSPKPVEKAAPVAAHVKIKEKKENKKKEKADTVVTESDQASGKSTLDSIDEKDADKCGVFTDFVTAYETKVKDGCPGSHCSVYKRNLKKYKLKKERYCQH
jgi:outer membrane biosynthesis protein TonB